MNPEIRVYDTAQEVAEAFAHFLEKRVNHSRRTTISLSGGSTPKLLFQHLAEQHQSSTEWQKAFFFWGDERCVPPEDDESNFKMTKEYLFDPIGIEEDNIFRILGENDPDEEAERYSQVMVENCNNADGLPSIDLMILGMGDDGHTASIFPHNIELMNSEKVCDVATHPTSGQKRVSMTGPVINNSDTIVFLVTGAKKAEKVKAILENADDATQYPAYYIKGQKLIWFLDKEAASLTNL